MPVFKVVVDRVEYLSAVIEVEAANEGVAREMAMDEVYSGDCEWDCYDSNTTIESCELTGDDDDFNNLAFA